MYGKGVLLHLEVEDQISFIKERNGPWREDEEEVAIGTCTRTEQLPMDGDGGRCMLISWRISIKFKNIINGPFVTRTHDSIYFRGILSWTGRGGAAIERERAEWKRSRSMNESIYNEEDVNPNILSHAWISHLFSWLDGFNFPEESAHRQRTKNGMNVGNL